jgi:hypothetical protein
LFKNILRKFQHKINGQLKANCFLDETAEDDVLVCYSKIVDVSKINTIEIYNSVLID